MVVIIDAANVVHDEVSVPVVVDVLVAAAAVVVLDHVAAAVVIGSYNFCS